MGLTGLLSNCVHVFAVEKTILPLAIFVLALESAHLGFLFIFVGVERGSNTLFRSGLKPGCRCQVDYSGVVALLQVSNCVGDGPAKP